MNSFLSYVGGKRLLAETICGIMPAHKLYGDVFAGAAWVYFRKNPATIEILNDRNSELVNLYRVVKHHLEEFARQFETILVSRDDFDRLKAQPPELLTDIQRAIRHYYLLRLAYASKVVNPTIAIARSRPLKLKINEVEQGLKHIHDRLGNTAIENLNYDKVIEKYDSEESLFYLDPPYWNCEDYYGKDLFRREDFARIAEICRGIKGKCIISINDVPEVREIFKSFNIRTAETKYSISGSNQSVGELLITNY